MGLNLPLEGGKHHSTVAEISCEKGTALLADDTVISVLYANLKRSFLNPNITMSASEVLNSPNACLNHKPVTKGPLFK